MTTFAKVKKAVVYLLALIGLAALGFFIWSATGSFVKSGYSGQPRSDFGSTGVAPLAPSSPFGGWSASNKMAESQRDVSSAVSGSESATARKVTKSGSLSLTVQNAEDVTEKIKNIAVQSKGFAASVSLYEVSDGVKSGNIAVRVPAASFDDAMKAIKALAVKVDRENIIQSDVTEQYVDLESRLKNYRVEEAQYLEIMKRAITIDDTLRTSRELSRTRGEIELIQGQLTYLTRQVDMATINISLTAEADIEIFGIRWRPLFVVKQALRNLFSGLAGYMDTMLAIVFLLPVILLWVATGIAILAIVFRLFLLAKRKFFQIG